MIRKRVPNDPKILALIDNAVQGTQRGATLTKRMLAFARRQELKQEVLEIPNIVRGMTELLQLSLGSSIEIETRFPLISKPVLADANQLEMVLLNLLVNARDAMPAGGKIVIAERDEAVSSGSVAVLKPGHYVCLSVRDTGTGMDEETLRRATEPFFTTNAGQGKASQGEAEYSEQEKQVGKVVRPRHDPGLDARGDEGHQADQGRLPHQVGGARSFKGEGRRHPALYPDPLREPGLIAQRPGKRELFWGGPLV